VTRPACLVLVLALWLLAPSVRAEQDAAAGRIRPLLERYCFGCHAGQKPKGDLDLSRLSTDFSDIKAAAIWQQALEQLTARTMPPAGKAQPAADEHRAITAWLAEGLLASDRARQKLEGRAVLRRLNRVEYDLTVRDLLAIDIDLKDLLPEDEAADGFDNVGAALTISPVLLERYLEAAEAALNAAIVKGPRPLTTRGRYTFKEEKSLSQRFLAKGGNIRLVDDRPVFLTSTPAMLRQFRPTFRGRYRFRISARAFDSDGKPLVLYAHALGDSALGGYFQVNAEATLIEFEGTFGPRDSFEVAAQGLGAAFYIRDLNLHQGPGLAIDWVEIEGPLLQDWPPESWRRVFGDVDPQAGTLADAERLLRRFLPRAFRRPTTAAQLAPYLALMKDRLDKKYSFEEALRVTLRAVLCSPHFLFLQEMPGPLDDFALASRLAYLLWKSAPDPELTGLAEAKKLRPALHAEVERMLRDRRAEALTKHFLGQWLDLRQIDANPPDKKLYPEYDDHLKHAMLRETELFFEEVLKNDLSLLRFVDADFSLLNEPLARHYGIPGVAGLEFRKVKLPPESHRGGVLTQAAVLKVTANGTTTSPVLRGVWVLKNLLGQTVPPPPPDVPAVDPDIRGATTMREQLARHRNVQACAVCHVQIDPPGFALENFDVIGGWRDHYRSLDQGAKVDLNARGQPVQYRLGPKVDAGDVLPDGRRFKDVADFKKLLLAEPDRVARCVAEKLIVYATGTSIRPADRAAIDAIVAEVRARNYGLRTLVHRVVASELFLSK
jgi:hypothetical protein